MRRRGKPETDLQTAIQDGLEKLGFWVMRVNAGKRGRVRMAPKGTPDLLCLLPYLWLEVKRPGEELNDNQVIWHEKAKKEGIPCCIVSSVGDAVTAVRGATMVESRERYRVIQEALDRLTGRAL